MKSVVLSRIDQIAPLIRAMAKTIGARPETGGQEVFACRTLTETLERFGFRMERNVLGLSTAFIAEMDSGKEGPVIAFFAEYDALPDIGHACGHHLICSMSTAAAVGLSAALETIGGKIRVYGTPAEETNGAKVPMAEAGLFQDVSFALMAHPYHRYEKSGSSMAMDALRFEYYGRAAHAAAHPEDGINALDAVIQLFNGVNALRQQTAPHARIHGIITHGGVAPNIIPDYAAAEFYVRSASRSYTNQLTERVKKAAEGAALQTGCTLNISNHELSYDELRTNETLSEQFTRNLVELGVPEREIHPGTDQGSLDLGNVSLQCPVAHPYVKVADGNVALHTIEFRDAAMQEQAFDSMILGAKALAGTAYDCAASPKILQAIREEFAAQSSSI